MKSKQLLKFYDKNNPFGALANTAGLKVQFSIDGKAVDAPSSECIYQAVKGLLNPNQNYKPLGQAILEGKHGYARSVQIAGQGFNNSNEIKVIHNNISGAPEAFKYYIMKDIVKAKLTQHPVLLKALMDKVNAGYEIIEDAPTDSYWGIGNGTGANKLGQILTEVTKELNAEMLQTGRFKIYNSFSTNTIIMLKAAGLSEPKIANVPDKFVTVADFNNLPINYNTESEIANYYNNVKTNNNQQSFTINANNMKNLADELVKKGQFGNFSTKSGKGVEVKCQVEQNGLVTVDTKNHNGRDVKIIYDTKSNQISENNQQVVDSKLGDWAFNIIKNYAERNMQAVKNINTQNNANNSTKITLVPVNKIGDYKDFLKQVIKQEPDCKFAAKSQSTPISVVIKHDQGIIIKGTDHKGNAITVKELVNGTIYENGSSVTDSGYLKWATEIICWTLNHSDQITVEALGAGDY